MSQTKNYIPLSKELEERIREDRENHVKNPYACSDDAVIRRDMAHDKQTIWRPAFVRDCEKIMHIPYYNRYADKTQVFSLYKNDDISRRASHVQLVSRTARNIGQALNLNLDLIEAISIGHDIGHTPFGHAGERTLNRICPMGFVHSEQSIRIVEKLEKDGQGLNLTKEVRDGILNHQTSSMPSTLEGKVVRLSDKIAYINHDIDDAIRAKIFSETDIPKAFTEVLGDTTKSRLNTMIQDIIHNSIGKNEICMSDEVHQAMMELRKFMFGSLYQNPLAKSEEAKADYGTVWILYG